MNLQMKRDIVIGDYLIKDFDTLHIYSTDGKLFLKETGQSPHELFPISEYEYVFSLLEFGVLFSKIENNKAQVLNFTGKNGLTAGRVAQAAKSE